MTGRVDGAVQSTAASVQPSGQRQAIPLNPGLYPAQKGEGAIGILPHRTNTNTHTMRTAKTRTEQEKR